MGWFGGVSLGLMARGSEVSGLVMAILALGVVVMILILGTFLARERYRRPPKPLSPVEFVHARREAEEVMAGLAPQAMLLAGMERAVARAADDHARDKDVRQGARELLESAAATGFWERFGAASVLVDEDPVGAIRELRRLPALLEASLDRVKRAGELLAGDPAVGVRFAGRSREDG
jgi:hypothetical protein